MQKACDPEKYVKVTHFTGNNEIVFFGTLHFHWLFNTYEYDSILSAKMSDNLRSLSVILGALMLSAHH